MAHESIHAYCISKFITMFFLCYICTWRTGRGRMIWDISILSYASKYLSVYRGISFSFRLQPCPPCLFFCLLSTWADLRCAPGGSVHGGHVGARLVGHVLEDEGEYAVIPLYRLAFWNVSKTLDNLPKKIWNGPPRNLRHQCETDRLVVGTTKLGKSYKKDTCRDHESY
jgi:hypothetical protein